MIRFGGMVPLGDHATSWAARDCQERCAAVLFAGDDVAEMATFLRCFQRGWPIGLRIWLLANLDLAGPGRCTDMSLRRKFWRACQDAERVGVDVVYDGEFTKDLVTRGGYRGGRR